MNPEMYVFRLYVAGDAPNSLRAIDNLTALCETHLPDRHEIEIVDICLDPERALNEAIFMTPTLVTVSPHPGRRIVGTLSSTEPILQILGLGPANRRAFAGLKDRHAAPQIRRSS
ncbi:MAG: circadian clock protein KaiB [Thermoanaerobaculia bacterium]|jgi:circadian clock protein KaiB|nr:circadian clock protein KaiB [Thermoanaerobaculia bacterium]